VAYSSVIVACVANLTFSKVMLNTNCVSHFQYSGCCVRFHLKAISWLHELCDIAGQSQPGITHTVQEAQELEQEQKKLEGTAQVVMT